MPLPTTVSKATGASLGTEWLVKPSEPSVHLADSPGSNPGPGSKQETRCLLNERMKSTSLLHPLTFQEETPPGPCTRLIVTTQWLLNSQPQAHTPAYKPPICAWCLCEHPPAQAPRFWQASHGPPGPQRAMPAPCQPNLPLRLLCRATLGCESPR